MSTISFRLMPRRTVSRTCIVVGTPISAAIKASSSSSSKAASICFAPAKTVSIFGESAPKVPVPARLHAPATARSKDRAQAQKSATARGWTSPEELLQLAWPVPAAGFQPQFELPANSPWRDGSDQARQNHPSFFSKRPLKPRFYRMKQNRCDYKQKSRVATKALSLKSTSASFRAIGPSGDRKQTIHEITRIYG